MSECILRLHIYKCFQEANFAIKEWGKCFPFFDFFHKDWCANFTILKSASWKHCVHTTDFTTLIHVTTFKSWDGEKLS